MDKLIIKSDDLKTVCSKILTAVDNTELSIVTETLELIAREKTLIIGVTNREYFVEVKLDLQDECDFHATVNASVFLKLISQITTEHISLSTNENTLIIKGNGTYKLPLIFDGEELLKLPKIEVENVTSEFAIPAETLYSILYYNSKELSKGTVTKPIQKLYYMDEFGAITFTSGACINNFTLESPVKLLFNNRLVKLFKLFNNGMVKFTLGYDAMSDEIVQTKVRFESPTVTLTAILSCDDTLLSQFPVTAVRARATASYPYSVSVNKTELIQTINRLTIFNTTASEIAKSYGIFEFGKEEVTIYDADRKSSEVIKYANGESSIEGVYSMRLKLDNLKATLETCNETHLCINFGDGVAVVIARGNVKNVIPEVRVV